MHYCSYKYTVFKRDVKCRSFFGLLQGNIALYFSRSENGFLLKFSQRQIRPGKIF